MDKQLIRTSRFLSLILRHKPETIGLALDAQGWVAIDTLLDALKRHGRTIARAELLMMVEQNNKQRFVIRDGRIRANQGHSISIDLGLEACEPPNVLYHGTAKRFLPSIRREGLKKMKRQHVHLSADIETATKVGIRHGRLAILRIDAHAMFAASIPFYVSENNVWLTDSVPWQYITEI